MKEKGRDPNSGTLAHKLDNNHCNPLMKDKMLGYSSFDASLIMNANA